MVHDPQFLFIPFLFFSLSPFFLSSQCNIQE